MTCFRASLNVAQEYLFN